MLTEKAKEILEKQQYRVVGSHSAVKVCGWTKNMIKGMGGCYKLKFYGIMSHQCLQMTPSMSCANRCEFCWRDYKAPVSKTWDWEIDDPEFILEQSLKAQKKLLEGFGGNEKANPNAYEASKEVKHVALSLTGEPIIYPKINELIKLFDKRGISTFLVCNAQHPQAIAQLAPVTQLYLSVDAPNKELLKKLDKPLFTDYWERFLASLDACAKKKERTCVRITMVKGLNDVEPEGYATIITRADADFVEVKGYMHVGASQERLERESMPDQKDVLAFTHTIVEHLLDYEIVSEHKPSRVVMLAKKKFKQEDGWHTWIDFKAYNKLVKAEGEADALSYSKKTPEELLGIREYEQEKINGRSNYLRQNDAETSYISICEQGDETELE